jgi:hypothetical protein
MWPGCIAGPVSALPLHGASGNTLRAGSTRAARQRRTSLCGYARLPISARSSAGATAVGQATYGTTTVGALKAPWGDLRHAWQRRMGRDCWTPNPRGAIDGSAFSRPEAETGVARLASRRGRGRSISIRSPADHKAFLQHRPTRRALARRLSKRKPNKRERYTADCLRRDRAFATQNNFAVGSQPRTRAKRCWD